MTLVCKAVDNLIPNAFLWLYHLSNSHVSLPNIDTSAKYSIWCYINISTPLGYRIVNISFTKCTSNAIIYLYKNNNSHVSLNVSLKNTGLGICAPNYIKVLRTKTQDSTFLIGLYKYKNSHVTVNENEAKIKLYIRINDKEKPKTKITFPKNGTIISTTVFKASFEDYDDTGLFCFYQIGNKIYPRKCNSTVYVNVYDCDTNPCTIKSIVVDYSGKIAENSISITLRNIPLLIQILAPDKIVVPISNPHTTFKIKIKNTLNRKLKINISARVSSLENVPNKLLPKVELSESVVKLDPGEEKEINVTIRGYRIGNYIIRFNFATNNGFSTEKAVIFIVSAVVAGTTIAIVEKILLPLLYLLP